MKLGDEVNEINLVNIFTNVIELILLFTLLKIKIYIEKKD